MLDKKSLLSLDNIQHDMCPSLTTNQVYRLCTTFWDDNIEQRNGSGLVSGEVLEGLKNQNIQSNGGLIVTFLLDDDAGLFFTSNGYVSSSVVASFGGEVRINAVTNRDRCQLST